MIAKSNVIIVDKVRITDTSSQDRAVNHALRTEGNLVMRWMAISKMNSAGTVRKMSVFHS